MTCYSTAITRRDCLERLTAASGLVFTSRVLSAAAAADREPLSFVVVSDTHLGRNDNDSATTAWREAAAEIAESDARFVLHLGDVVDGGRSERYAEYLAIRNQIDKPVYEIPGNHDPVDAFASQLRREVDAVFDHGWLRVILLSNAHRDSHDGFFAPEQIAWTDEKLQQAAENNRASIVCCHVPVHTNQHPDRGWYVKPESGQTEFYEVLERHQRHVLALFHGHFHNGIRGWDDRAGLHEICFPSVLYNQNRELEKQDAAGYNPDEFRPGYTLVTAGDGELRLRYKPTGGEATVRHTCEAPGVRF